MFDVGTDRDFTDVMEEIRDSYQSPSNKPTESEKHVPFVTPRAFTSEIGYDLDGVTRIDAGLATVLSRSDLVTELALLSRSSGAVDEEDLATAKRYADHDGQVSVRIWRIDAGKDTGERMPAVTDWARGGFLIRYNGCYAEEVDDAHDEVGWFHSPEEGPIKELLQHLLLDEVHYRQHRHADGEFPTLKVDREKDIRTTPSLRPGTEQWSVIEYNANGIMDQNMRNLFERHLLFDTAGVRALDAPSATPGGDAAES